MARHIVAIPEIPPSGQTLRVVGEEAHHAARVKRLREGDRVDLRTGRGHIGHGRVQTIARDKKGEWAFEVCVDSCAEVPGPTPRLVIRSGAPKGDRLEQMIESLSQVGAASWGPLGCALSVVEPREGKLARLERVAVESMKQCGRAWTLAIDDARAFESALGPGVILADASGGPYTPSGADTLTLLIGPEGGLTSEEIALARAAGCTIASFGVHTMRVETAAVVAAALVLELERSVRR